MVLVTHPPTRLYRDIDYTEHFEKMCWDAYDDGGNIVFD